LLPLSDIARRTLPERLSQHGAQVIEVVAYINAPVGEPPETVIRALAQDEIHWALFTSPSTVRNFITSLKDHPEVLSHLHAASIGPTTSAALRELGLEPCIEAREHTLDGLLEAIAQIRM
jgi:uroporphyrinogen III methyltransferase/synthase